MIEASREAQTATRRRRPRTDRAPALAASSGHPQLPRPRRWPRRVAIGALLGTALFAITGFFVVPPVARHVAQKQLGDLTGRKVVIDRIRFNPFALGLAVEGLRVYERDGVTPFVGWKRLYVNAELASVWKRAPVVRQVSLESLRVHVVRSRATADTFADVASAYNFSDIVTRLSRAAHRPLRCGGDEEALAGDGDPSGTNRECAAQGRWQDGSGGARAQDHRWRGTRLRWGHVLRGSHGPSELRS